MQKYSNLQIAYHWLTAILVLFLAGSGLAFSYEIADAGSGAIFAHQIAGQLLIVVLTLRILTRVLRKMPKIETAHARWERWTAHGIHIALYIVLIAFVMTGYVSASAITNNALAAPANIGFAHSDTGEFLLEIHYSLKWALLGLLGLHLAGAIKHVLVDRDSTLSNMQFRKLK